MGHWFSYLIFFFFLLNPKYQQSSKYKISVRTLTVNRRKGIFFIKINTVKLVLKYRSEIEKKIWCNLGILMLTIIITFSDICKKDKYSNENNNF